MEGASLLVSSMCPPFPPSISAPSSSGALRLAACRKPIKLRAAASADQLASSALSAPPGSSTAVEVVTAFYDGINHHDLLSVEGLIAENCVYEDLVFPQPFSGRKATLDFFNKFIDYISTDVQFVIDDISEGDPAVVGVTWHLEWRGRPFPFSRGCSFYRLQTINGRRQIIYARDCVEPAVKPGELALVMIRGVTFLLQRFSQLAKFL